MIKPSIELIDSKILIGMSIEMSLMDNKTPYLWKNFMPRRNEIENPIGTDLFSLQIYPVDYFKSFNPATNFQKWACMEVGSVKNTPENMHKIELPAGLYAKFKYTGLSTDTSIFQYIFNTWLPQSEYTLDNRPHFEILGERYKNNDPNSEEDIFIPVKFK